MEGLSFVALIFLLRNSFQEFAIYFAFILKPIFISYLEIMAQIYKKLMEASNYFLS